MWCIFDEPFNILTSFIHGHFIQKGISINSSTISFWSWVICQFLSNDQWKAFMRRKEQNLWFNLLTCCVCDLMIIIIHYSPIVHPDIYLSLHSKQILISHKTHLNGTWHKMRTKYFNYNVSIEQWNHYNECNIKTIKN